MTVGPRLADAIRRRLVADPKERRPSMEAFLKKIEKVEYEDKLR